MIYSLRTKPNTPWLPLTLAGILLLALLVRIPLINGSFWLDEAAQALESARPLTDQLDIAYDFQPPLIHLITHFALYFSSAEWWLRWWGALLPGLVTLWGTYHIGKKLFSTSVATTATLLLGLNSYHIFYSQELRPYSLPAALATASWLVLLSTETGGQKQLSSSKHSFQSKLQPWLLFGVLTALGLYSSYLYPFLLLAQITYLFFGQRKIFVLALLSVGGAAIAFLPWIPALVEQLRVGGELRTALPGWENVVSIPQFKSLALVFGKFVFGVIDLTPTLLAWTLGFIVCLGLYVLAYEQAKQNSLLQWVSQFYRWIGQRQRHQFERGLLIVSIWVLLPILTAWIVSFWIPILHPKRVLFALPAFYLLVTAVTLRFQHQTVRFALLAVLLGIQLYGLVSYWTQPQLQRENWVALYQTINASYPSDRTILIFSFSEPFAPWLWYADDSYPTLATGLQVNPEKLPQQLKPALDYDYVLVFDYLRTLSDPHDNIPATLDAFGYAEVTTLDQDTIGFVRVFAKRTALLSYQP